MKNYSASHLFLLKKRGLAFVIVVFSLLACSEKPSHFETKTLRLALAMQPSSSLVMVAQEKDYFRKHGLELEVEEYPSGKRALHESFFKGKSDIALSADVPVAMAALVKKDFLILASIFSANNVNRIIARKDAGIQSEADLRGKKIATQKSSAVHFFLNLFLVEHGIVKEEIESFFFKAEQLPDKLAEGTIDAFSMREPYISQAKKKLEGNYIVFSQPGLYQQREMIISNRQYVKENPEAIKRFIKSLLEAEIFVRENPKQAIKIISTRLGVSKASLEANWPEVSMRVLVDQSMLLVLEEISRWAIQEQLTDVTSMPNYLEFLHFEPLHGLSDSSVTIIH